MVSLYLLPLMIMLFCYAKIFCVMNIHTDLQSIEMKILNKDHNKDNNEIKLNKINKLVRKTNSFYKMRHKTLKMSALFGKYLILGILHNTYFNTSILNAYAFFCVVFAFALSWTPYYVFVIIAIFSQSNAMSSEANKYFFMFSVTNSCLANPFIYGNIYFSF